MFELPDQYHFSGFDKIACLQAIEIFTAGQRVRVPLNLVIARRFIFANKSCHFLAGEIEHFNRHIARTGYFIVNRRARIERVGIILREPICAWNGWLFIVDRDRSLCIFDRGISCPVRIITSAPAPSCHHDIIFDII